MRLKLIALGPRAVTAVPAAVAAAQAEDGIYIPLFTYRTGPFAGSGIPIANGLSDYLNMLNERDGGIGGVKLIVEECETGYDTKKGVECYDAVKERPGRHQPLFDRHHAAADPQSVGRQNPGFLVRLRPLGIRRRQLSSRGSSIRRLPTGTAPPRSSGMRPTSKAASTSSRARRSASSISTRPTARSRSRCCRRWPRTTASSSSSIRLPHRRCRTRARSGSTCGATGRTGSIIQGWGAMNPTAIKEAAKIGFPMDRLVGVWWSGGDDDARPAGAEAKGYSSLDLNGVGTELSGDPGHPQIRGRQGQKPGRLEGQGRRESL